MTSLVLGSAVSMVTIHVWVALNGAALADRHVVSILVKLAGYARMRRSPTWDQVPGKLHIHLHPMIGTIYHAMHSTGILKLRWICLPFCEGVRPEPHDDGLAGMCS